MLRSEVKSLLVRLAMVLASCAAVPVMFGLWLAHTDSAVERATATAVGRVERVERGRGSSVIVAWTDSHGAPHSEQFALSDPDRYRPGDSYPLRYDPDAADPHAVPAEAGDLTDLRDVKLVPLILTAIAGTAVAVFWTGRTFLYLLVRRAPSAPGLARVGRAPLNHGAWRPVARVRWQSASGHPIEGWQPVLPGPAETALRGTASAGDTPVLVHQLTTGGRVALVLPDGSALVPGGRLHTSEPPGWDDSPQPPLPGTPPPPREGWQFRCAFAGTAAGAAAAPGAWYLTGQSAATVAITLAVAAFATTGMWLREIQRAV